MNGLPRRGYWVMGTIGCVVLAGCGNWMEPESPGGREELAVTRGAVTTSPPPSTFAVLARHGATFSDRASVSGGNIGVLPSGTGTPNAISGGSGVHLAVGHEVMAERVSVGGSSVLGNIDANQIVTNGSITGNQSAFVSPPAPPVPGAATPGTTAVTVNSGQTRPLAAGAFGAVSVSGTLNLSGGTYNFRSLQVNNDGRVVALAGSVVRVSTGITGLDRSHLVVAAGLRADSLRLEPSGSVDGNNTGVALGNDAELTAVVVAQGAFRAGDRLTATGAIAAQDVSLGFDARLFFDIGFNCTSDTQCNDGNACTVDSCVSGRCQNAPTNTCAVAVSAGFDHSCAVEADGRVACWGNGERGQLGDGTGLNRQVPTFVPGVVDAVAVSGGEFFHTCVLRANGGVLCWGENAFGELGDGTTVRRLSPVAAVLPRPAVSISMSGDDGDLTAHACAVLDDHTVWCWGSNNFGSLGDGTVTSRVTPAPVPGLANAVSVAVGEGTSCALFSSGTASCWGLNDHGSLGDGDASIDDQSTVPVSVVGVSNGAVLGFSFQGLILTRTGSLLSWGFNKFDGVGDGTNIDRPTPVVVPGLNDIVAIGAGNHHSCVVHATGTVSCWGFNPSGGLGNGTTVDSTLPVNVIGLTGVKAVAAGTQHSCAAKSDGSVWCWGGNANGTLGNGTLTDSSTPVRAAL